VKDDVFAAGCTTISSELVRAPSVAVMRTQPGATAVTGTGIDVPRMLRDDGIVATAVLDDLNVTCVTLLAVTESRVTTAIVVAPARTENAEMLKCVSLAAAAA
jgi:hypothetical protein